MFGLFNRSNDKVIHVNDMDQFIGKVDIIDIREPYEYKTGSLVSAKNIPMDQLINNPDQYMRKDKTYYIMCQSGGRSGRTCNFLTQQGFDVMNVSGGFGSYIGTKRK